MIRSATAVVAGLVLVGSTFIAPPPSWAGRGGMGGGKFTITEVQAELTPCCGDPEPNAEGEAERKTVSKNGSPLLDFFEAKVEIPIPSAGLGITDPTTADVRIELSHPEGPAYAECFLVLDQDEQGNQQGGDGDGDDNGQDTAEFEVLVVSFVKMGSPVVKQVKGQCDIDLTTAGVQPGVPPVVAGDVATVRMVNSGTPTDFLQGTFNPD